MCSGPEGNRTPLSQPSPTSSTQSSWPFFFSLVFWRIDVLGIGKAGCQAPGRHYWWLQGGCLGSDLSSASNPLD